MKATVRFRAQAHKYLGLRQLRRAGFKHRLFFYVYVRKTSELRQQALWGFSRVRHPDPAFGAPRISGHQIGAIVFWPDVEKATKPL